MTKRCFLVTGGESTGTRMMMRALILVGIYELEMPRGFDWAYGELPDLSKPIVEFYSKTLASVTPINDICLHVGMPMGGYWSNLWEVTKRLRNEGYTVEPIVMTREWNATAQSQVRRKFVDSTTHARVNLIQAYRQITQQLNLYEMVSYEAFCANPQYRKQLFEMWGLPESPIDIWEANGQYYD